MTVGAWLGRRTPPPPPALRRRVELALGKSLTLDEGSAAEACLASAERLLSELLRSDCTTRESALDLLTADALATYAFEAAGESAAGLASRAAESMRRIASLGVVQGEGATT